MNNDIDITDSPEHLANCPVTRYLLETKVDANPWSTLEWLQNVDQDTANMIEGYLAKAEGMTEEQLHNSPDVEDYAFLILYCVSFELGIPVEELVERDDFSEIQQAAGDIFSVFSVGDSLRRKGLVSFEGTGRITEPENTRMVSTEMGKEMLKGLGGNDGLS